MVAFGLVLCVPARGESEGTRLGSGAFVQASGTNVTVITSERLEFDYKRYIAVFEENVVVVDPRVRIETDHLVVCFDGTNDVKSVTALGNVRIRSEDKRGYCRKAVYVARTGEVVMTGDAKLHRSKDSVMGDLITFWLDEERMKCTPGRLIIYPKESQGAGRPAVAR